MSALSSVTSTLATLLLASVLAWSIRRHPHGLLAPGVRVGLLVVLVGLVIFELVVAWREGWLSLQVVLPLQLCDAAIVVAVAALVSLRQPLVEILYFWAMSGSMLALLTPDMGMRAPLWERLVFVGLHGGVMVAAVVLVFGFDRRPGRGAHWRVFAITNVLVLIAALVNWAWGTNYLYLRAKPIHPTLLDHFGPWPTYILVGEGLAAALFWILALPFRERSSRR